MQEETQEKAMRSQRMRKVESDVTLKIGAVLTMVLNIQNTFVLKLSYEKLSQNLCNNRSDRFRLNKIN